MPRPALSVEFLNKLKSLVGIAKTTHFARACGQQQSNMANYLNANIVPGDAVLKSCLDELFAWQVVPHCEVEAIGRPRDVPDEPGVYVFYDHNFKVIYIGQAESLRGETYQTLHTRNIPGLVNKKIGVRAEYYSLYIVRNMRLRHNLEQLLIRVCGHETYNTNVGQYLDPS